MNKKIGILGSGVVGITLANGLQDLGHDVQLANRQGHSVDGWQGTVGTYAQVAARSDFLILAVKGTAAEAVIAALKNELAHKIVVDTTNPIADCAPDEGVLQYFTTPNESLMERLQANVPDAHFVKAFNSVGSAYMINPLFNEGIPTMFICGNDAAAKQEVREILTHLGWESEDMGGVKSARAIEPLCMLWCLPGILRNEWSHAFKLFKA